MTNSEAMTSPNSFPQQIDSWEAGYNLVRWGFSDRPPELSVVLQAFFKRLDIDWHYVLSQSQDPYLGFIDALRYRPQYIGDWFLLGIRSYWIINLQTGSQQMQRNRLDHLSYFPYDLMHAGLSWAEAHEIFTLANDVSEGKNAQLFDRLRKRLHDLAAIQSKRIERLSVQPIFTPSGPPPGVEIIRPGGAKPRGATLLIHGHDDVNKLLLKDILTHKLSLPEPIVMAQRMVPGKALPEKFEELASKVEFAIALLTPDDVGRAKSSSRNSPRVRQNILVEIGWFWGRLGRENVLLLVRKQVEIPSDFQGLEYYTFEEKVEERTEVIRDFYKAHGLTIK